MMLQFQNTYTPAAAGQGMSGRQTMPTDYWSAEITPLPAAQGQARPGADTGIGGIAESGSEMAANVGSQELDMRSGLPADVIEAPTTVDEAYRGSLKAMLSRNIGTFVVATFLLGTQGTVSWEGILYDVGNDFVTIYQVGRDRYIVSDIYSLKYIEFYDTRRRAQCEQMMRDSAVQNGQMNDR